jgi:hypothetical protein
MKKLLLLSLIGCASLAIAQPVMQNIMPIGFTCTMSFGPAGSPGAGGANQTWNLSAIPATPSATMTIVSPGSTPCGSSFPSANWAQDISGAQYNYYASTSAQLEVLGEQFPSSCSGGITYTSPKTVLQFPFNYTNSFTDTYSTGTGTGTVTTTYDGYGTLITPSGTYTNVTRVTFTDGGSITYEWFDTGAWGHPLAMIVGSSTIFFTNPSVGIKEQPTKNIALSPNPSEGLFTLSNLPYEKMDMQVMAADGRIVFAGAVLNNSSVDLQYLPAGIYCLSLRSGQEMLTTRLVITE